MELDNFWPTTRAEPPIISDEELEYLFLIDKEEILWRESLPKYSFSELMKIYAPEAIKAARTGLKNKLIINKRKLRELETYKEEYYENRICKMPWQERNDFEEESNKDFDEMRKKIESKIKTIMFNLSYLNTLEGKSLPISMGGVSEADVARAKEVSIINYHQGKLQIHGNRAVGICPFHHETNSSFVVYTDQNTWWCYSENIGGTIIDYITRQQNVSFLDAVKFLLK